MDGFNQAVTVFANGRRLSGDISPIIKPDMTPEQITEGVRERVGKARRQEMYLVGDIAYDASGQPLYDVLLDADGKPSYDENGDQQTILRMLLVLSPVTGPQDANGRDRRLRIPLSKITDDGAIFVVVGNIVYVELAAVMHDDTRQGMSMAFWRECADENEVAEVRTTLEQILTCNYTVSEELVPVHERFLESDFSGITGDDVWDYAACAWVPAPDFCDTWYINRPEEPEDEPATPDGPGPVSFDGPDAVPLDEPHAPDASAADAHAADEKQPIVVQPVFHDELSAPERFVTFDGGDDVPVTDVEEEPAPEPDPEPAPATEADDAAVLDAEPEPACEDGIDGGIDLDDELDDGYEAEETEPDPQPIIDRIMAESASGDDNAELLGGALSLISRLRDGIGEKDEAIRAKLEADASAVGEDPHRQISFLLERLEHEITNNADLKERYGMLQGECDKAKYAREIAESARDDERKSVARIREELKHERQQADASRKERDEVIERAQKRRIELEKARAAAEAKASRAQQDAENERAARVQADQRVIEMREEAAGIKREYEDRLHDLKNREASARSYIMASRAASDQIASEYDAYRAKAAADADASRRMVEKSYQETINSERDASLAATEMLRVRRQMENSQAADPELQTKLEQAVAEAAELRRQVSDLSGRLEATKSRADADKAELNEQLSQTRAALDESNEVVADLRDELDRANETERSASGRIDDVQRQLDDLRASTDGEFKSFDAAFASMRSAAARVSSTMENKRKYFTRRRELEDVTSDVDAFLSSFYAADDVIRQHRGGAPVVMPHDEEPMGAPIPQTETTDGTMPVPVEDEEQDDGQDQMYFEDLSDIDFD